MRQELKSLLLEGFDVIVDAAELLRDANALRAAGDAGVAGDAVVRLAYCLDSLVVGGEVCFPEFPEILLFSALRDEAGVDAEL